MIELLPQTSDKVLAFKMSGKLHDEDYKQFVPLVDASIAKQGKVRLLAQFHDFHGWDLHALWDDIKFSTTHCAKIERIAMVGDKKWERWMAAVAASRSRWRRSNTSTSPNWTRPKSGSPRHERRRHTMASETLPVCYLARHGETAWSLTGQHTGRADIQLTERGEREACSLGERHAGRTFARVFASPLQRAARTCALAGFEAAAEIDPGPRRMELWQIRRARSGRRSSRNGPTGCCFATAALAARCRLTFANAPIASSPRSVRSIRTCCFFRAGTSCACWPRAGSGSIHPRVAYFCSAPRV